MWTNKHFAVSAVGIEKDGQEAQATLSLAFLRTVAC